MATLRIKYGGALVAQMAITLDPKGWYIESLLMSDGTSKQFGTIWRVMTTAVLNKQDAAVNSAIDKDYEITIQADNQSEFLKDSDFMQLRDLKLEWLYE